MPESDSVAVAKPADEEVKTSSTSSKYSGKHKFRVNHCEFDVDRKYFPVKVLGLGAYGVVCLVEDQEDNKAKVAIKKCPRAFQDLVDAKRILREIKLLRHFNHPQIIGIRDLIPPRSLGYIEDVYIVMESMEANLHKIIYSKQKLSNDHIQYFMYQILKGLKYLHSAGVIHRDLKPSNLLVNHNCDLKICDFGLARGTSENPLLTEYVVTRHYRAPEVMVNAKKYDAQIDVWSVGCIFAELLGRKPLFPGGDYLEQLRLIVAKVGSPAKDDLEEIPTPAARSYLEGLGGQKKAVWKEMFPTATSLAIDLLDKLLQFNPKKRITVDDALKHDYFKALHKESSIVECKEVVQIDWEKEELDEEKIQNLMWEEIYFFRPAAKEERERLIKSGAIADFQTLRLAAKKAREKADKGSRSSSTSRGSTAASAAAKSATSDSSTSGAKEEGKEREKTKEEASVISEPVADEPEGAK